MAQKVWPEPELRELLGSIRRSCEILKGRAPHHSLIDWIDRVLGDIELAEAQPLPEAAVKILDGYEAYLNRLRVQCSNARERVG